jgi:hypothetical protein
MFWKMTDSPTGTMRPGPEKAVESEPFHCPISRPSDDRVIAELPLAALLQVAAGRSRQGPVTSVVLPVTAEVTAVEAGSPL